MELTFETLRGAIKKLVSEIESERHVVKVLKSGLVKKSSKLKVLQQVYRAWAKGNTEKVNEIVDAYVKNNSPIN